MVSKLVGVLVDTNDRSYVLRYRWSVKLLCLAFCIGVTACGEAAGDEQEELEESEEDKSDVELGEPSDAELPDGEPSEEEDASEDEEDASEDEEDASEDESDANEDGDADEESEADDDDASEEPSKEPEKPKDDGPKEDVCNETVPAKHYVDDIPAYSQCAESLNAKIWSKDGVSTSTSQKGDGWVPTQWGGGYQCTEFAKRYMYFRFGVEKFPNGNAGVWCEGTTPEGLEKTSEPVHGDLIIFGPGSCGASLATGHVGVVDKVDKGKQSVEFVEQNQANRRVCAISTAACFLHAKSNK